MTFRRTSRRLVAALAGGALTLGAAACGGEDDADPGTTEQASPPAADAQVSPIVGGATVLKLDATLRHAFDVAGVELQPVGDAQAIANGIRFPISDGRVHDSRLDARIEHEGGLEFSAAGESITATNLVIDRGEGVLTAEIDGRRVPLLSLDYGRPRPLETSDTLVLPAAAGTLADEAIAELNERLGVDVFEDGLRLGRVTTSAELD